MSSNEVQRTLPVIAVFGADATEVSALGRSLHERLGWTFCPMSWSGDGMPPAAQGVLTLGEVPAAAAARLAARSAGMFLVGIGAQLPAELRAACVFPTPPPPRTLAMVLALLVEVRRPEALTFRRKSDMIVGRSPAVEQLLNMLDRLAPSTASVLVTGESGTGKELVARALHYAGPRASGPFIAVNCAAIPESLFESELFGNVRGAFTGAVAARAGVFEAAHGGTLFLDEIGEIPVALQSKLLRVLETGQFSRLGSTELREASVRLVTATNRDLDAEIRAGRFRDDLYYRIRVFHLNVPPLRERPEDIPALVHHFLGQLAARDHRAVSSITPAALEKLLAHRWPGNVRELFHAVERALVLVAAGHPIDAEHIPLSGTPAPLLESYRDARDRFEATYYAQLLRTAGGNISLVAKMAGRTRAQVYEALRRHELDPAPFRTLNPPSS